MIMLLVLVGWLVLLAPVSFVAVAACRSGRRDDLAHGRYQPPASGAARRLAVQANQAELAVVH